MGKKVSKPEKKRENKTKEQEDIVEEIPASKSAVAKSNFVNSSNRMIKDSIAVLSSINPNPEVGIALKKVPLFRQLTDEERSKLGGALEERSFSSGQFVFQEGDKAKDFYIIKEGKASVLKMDVVDEKKEQAFLRQLVEGDHFGESALLDPNGILNASVRADSFLVLWTLHKLEFSKLFKPERINIAFATRGALTGEARGAVNAGLMEEKLDSPIPRVNMNDIERKNIHEAIKKNQISRSPLFARFDEASLDLVVQTMELRTVSAGEIILKEGIAGDKYYVIQEGEVDFYQNSQIVDHKIAGESFGELALIHNDKRNATVKATTNVKLRELRRLWVHRVAKKVVRAVENTHRLWLNKIDLLAPLTEADRARIAEALEVVCFNDGQVIFQQGDEGHALYLVAEGQVSFSATNPNTGEKLKMKVETMEQGGYFGERALLNNKPRSATVKSLGDCKLLKLEREAVNRLLGPLEVILKKKVKTYESKADKTEWEPAGIPFDDLKVIGTLGRGSYGYVQLVKDSKGKAYALKAISKQRIVDTHQKDHIFNEKKLMMELDHPFLIKLYQTYKNKDRLYFLLEPSLGGELFPILRKMRTMAPRQSRFYAAQVTLCFQYLHAKEFVYRDLKPENLLLDEKGYLKLVDFGFMKRISCKTYTMCGTPEYMAPEIISHAGHGKGVDWWTLGIFIFEMLASHTPFYVRGSDNMKMYERIQDGRFSFPSYVDKKARPLIEGLLKTKPHERYGCLLRGVDDIIKDDWFVSAGFDWKGLSWKSLPPPMKVKVKDSFDLTNFKQGIREKPVKPYIPDGTNWDKDF